MQRLFVQHEYTNYMYIMYRQTDLPYIPLSEKWKRKSKMKELKILKNVQLSILETKFVSIVLWLSFWETKKISTRSPRIVFSSTNIAKNWSSRWTAKIFTLNATRTHFLVSSYHGIERIHFNLLFLSKITVESLWRQTPLASHCTCDTQTVNMSAPKFFAINCSIILIILFCVFFADTRYHSNSIQIHSFFCSSNKSK